MSKQERKLVAVNSGDWKEGKALQARFKKQMPGSLIHADIYREGVKAIGHMLQRKTQNQEPSTKGKV